MEILPILLAVQPLSMVAIRTLFIPLGFFQWVHLLPLDNVSNWIGSTGLYEVLCPMYRVVFSVIGIESIGIDESCNI